VLGQVRSLADELSLWSHPQRQDRAHGAPVTSFYVDCRLFRPSAHDAFLAALKLGKNDTGEAEGGLSPPASAPAKGKKAKGKKTQRRSPCQRQRRHWRDGQ